MDALMEPCPLNLPPINYCEDTTDEYQTQIVDDHRSDCPGPLLLEHCQRSEQNLHDSRELVILASELKADLEHGAFGIGGRHGCRLAPKRIDAHSSRGRRRDCF